MDIDELRKFIDTNSESEIYHEFLVGQDVWYFRRENEGDKYSINYDEFKKFISIKLDVPFNNISIVGSAKTQFSFSPHKKFKEFNDSSDFDLIIVSRLLYKKIWAAYKNISQQTYLHQHKVICSNIFNGFVSIKDNDKTYGEDALEEWQRKVRTFKADLQLKFNIEHDINYRIYSDWESVQEYHIRGIAKLKSEIKK
ncbi:hypothetical protein [Cobetia crustatorum]|uniref:Uncharacterized protein n=1 Tax=Cobetia crustatorum TaxID=553385 RepID=A0A558HUE4_9GAMM|nr:hypothetical protein [Cobetia crustatorum]TVU72749.1 hypothetical protein FQP86_03500 [Cobetia crustatorum]